MKILIPAAGLGTRLRPHTHHRPKPLVQVAGNTVLGHVLDKLRELDIDEIVFIVGHLGDQIESYVRAHYDFPARYVVQKELLGQAHAIMLAREWIDGPLFIVFVDTIFEADLSGLGETPADGILYVHEVEDPSRFGVVTIGEDGCIRELVEKPSEPVSNLAIVGLYYIKDGRRLIEAIDELIARDMQTKGEFYLADALRLMIEKGARIQTRPVSVWEDCGTRPALLRTNRYLLGLLEATEPPATVGRGAVIIQPAVISADAVIANSVVGPYAHVGSACRIEGSVVGPHVSLGDGVSVTGSLLRDVIAERGAQITHAALTASLIGADAQIRGGMGQLNVGDSSEIEQAGGVDDIPAGPGQGNADM